MLNIENGYMMHALVRRCDVYDSRPWVLTATVDNRGPRFELSPLEGVGRESSVLTLDDACFAHTFLEPIHGVDIEDEVRRVLNAEVVFEVAVEVAYEGTYKARLFATYSEARKYAESLSETARYPARDATVTITPRELHRAA